MSCSDEDADDASNIYADLEGGSRRSSTINSASCILSPSITLSVSTPMRYALARPRCSACLTSLVRRHGRWVGGGIAVLSHSVVGWYIKQGRSTLANANAYFGGRWCISGSDVAITPWSYIAAGTRYRAVPLDVYGDIDVDGDEEDEQRDAPSVALTFHRIVAHVHRQRLFRHASCAPDLSERTRTFPHTIGVTTTRSHCNSQVPLQIDGSD
jgi:hypothetical protein